MVARLENPVGCHGSWNCGWRQKKKLNIGMCSNLSRLSGTNVGSDAQGQRIRC